MPTPIQEALELLLTGMTTVALVLGMVVGTGRLLIYFVNRTENKAITAPSAPTNNTEAPLPSATIAVLTAAVEVATEGQGRIKSIETIPS